MFTNAAAYQAFMGRYSDLLGAEVRAPRQASMPVSACSTSAAAQAR